MLPSKSQNIRGFTLIEIIICIFAEMIVLFGFASVASTVGNDFWYVRARATVYEETERFHTDMASVLSGYPKLVYTDGSYLVQSKLGFSLSVFENASGEGMIIGTMNQDGSWSVAVGVPTEYRDYVPFFLPLTKVKLAAIKAAGTLNPATIDLTGKYTYPSLHVLKFGIVRWNGNFYRIDITVSDLYSPKKAGQSATSIRNDADNRFFNSSFFVQ